MSSTQQQTRMLGGIKTPLCWLLAFMVLLYIIYSSLLLINNPTNRKCLAPEEDTTNLQLFSTNSSASFTTLRVSKQGKGKAKGGKSRGADNKTVQPMVFPVRSGNYDTQIKHIAFGIAASADLWQKRKEYVKIWWRPRETRGIVWMDRRVAKTQNEGLPEVRVSADSSRFKYTNTQGHRSAIRISRVVSEMLRLEMKNVRWFVMGDDDTVFIVDNVVRILSKYDHRQFYYIGSSSESHLQNIYFSYSMAYGGGGFAISYPLAKELATMQDRCIQRYPGLYGSDDRMHACMAELGVPLTKEPGFHQYDVFGNLLGLLAAHPVTPLASLHHLDVVEPIFPKMTRVQSLRHLFYSVNQDSASIMQQSICYDKKRQWSISVSWGFVVQIWRGVLSPRELEMPTRTFLNWYRRADYTAYAFNTRPVMKHPCLKPFVFYMSTTKMDRTKNEILGFYNPHRSHEPQCRWKMDSPGKVDSVVVFKKADRRRWQKSPRRDCCRVMESSRLTSLRLWVGNCRKGEISELQQQKPH